ncbi:hypothetical protein AAG906_015592 [Vitis piasezkii]
MASSSILRRRCIRGVLQGPTPFFYFSLGCYAMFWRIWVSLQTLILRPTAIVERASLLTNGIRYCTISIPQNFPSQGKFLHTLTIYICSIHFSSLSPYEASSMPYCCSSYPSHPLLSQCEFHDLLASFQTLTTTQTTIMERMDHLQLRQDQQTLILREIQQHLGLLPPAPLFLLCPRAFHSGDDATPVAVPSTVAAEDPPIHQRSLLLDHTITPLPFFFPYYQEVSLPPFYYHLFWEHWGQCSFYALSLYWLGVTDLTARYMGGWVSYLMTLVDD